VVRFFTKTIGSFEGHLDFENFFSLTNYSLDTVGNADFPTISTLPKNIYWNVKKSRPKDPPDCYLSKAFVQTENLFDFGPLLIGKQVANRNTNEMKKINSTTFRISNQGKFKANLSFALLSQVTDNHV
jgi:hydrocephalus-inducing protein